jgi:hypothetical protein
MKIYIIIEGHYDRIIRGITLCKETAEKICEMFSYLGIFIEEYETLEDENLKNLLSEIKL